jgi:hypothetical protein
MLTPQPPLDMAVDNVGLVLTQVGRPATFAVACVVVKLVADAVGIPSARGQPLPRATQQVRA